MKAIFDDIVLKHICFLCEKFVNMKVDSRKISELTKFYRKSTAKVSDEDMEKIIACIYALQVKGIPLKASSTELGVNIGITLDIFKRLRKPSIQYVPLFINLLKSGYSNGLSEQFDNLFKKISPEVTDHFALATVLNVELRKREKLKKNKKYFGYSEVTVIRYRKMIQSELNGR